MGYDYAQVFGSYSSTISNIGSESYLFGGININSLTNSAAINTSINTIISNDLNKSAQLLANIKISKDLSSRQLDNYFTQVQAKIIGQININLLNNIQEQLRPIKSGIAQFQNLINTRSIQIEANIISYSQQLINSRIQAQQIALYYKEIEKISASVTVDASNSFIKKFQTDAAFTQKLINEKSLQVVSQLRTNYKLPPFQYETWENYIKI